MPADRIDAINELLEQTKEAHGVFESAELNGVYDQDWPRWYASYAVEHGIAALLDRAVTVDDLAEFLARSNAEFEQMEPKPIDSWAGYTARRMSAEL